MKRQEQEVYGFGARLPTRPGPWAVGARLVLLAALCAAIAAWLVW